MLSLDCSKWVVEDAVVEDIAEEFRRGVLVCIWGGGDPARGDTGLHVLGNRFRSPERG